MKEYEFLLNIDNKEILIEILNHSIDYLIGNQDEQQTMRMSHKYGFHNPDDFLLTTRTISKFYRNLCSGDLGNGTENDVKYELANLTPELQKIIPSVLQSRRNEVLRYLIRQQNASEYPLIESFDWDTRLVLGDSSFAQNHTILTTVTFRLCHNRGLKQHKSNELHIEMDRKKLDELIETIEESLQDNCK